MAIWSAHRPLIRGAAMAAWFALSATAQAVTVQVNNAAASPGQQVTLVLTLANDISVRGVQVTLTPDPTVLSLVAVRNTTRSQFLSANANQDASSSAITAILMSLGTAVIAPGTGPVMEVDVQVGAAVPAGSLVDVLLSGVRVADSQGQPVTNDSVSGVLTVPEPTATATPLPTPTPTPDPCGLCGDTNGNGVVDIVDALFIAQHTVDLRPTLRCPIAADVTRSGVVDIVDALFISQYTVQLRTPLTCVTGAVGAARASP